MPSTVFTPQVSAIKSAWLNAVNNAVFPSTSNAGARTSCVSMQALRATDSTIASYADVIAYFAGDTTGGGRFSANSADTTSGWYGTGSISGTTLTIVSTVNGAPAIGQQINYAGSDGSVYIVSGSGTTWALNKSLAVASTRMTGDYGGGVIVALDGMRWYLTNEGVVSLTNFGAQSGSDATYQFQAALIQMAGKDLYAGGSSDAFTISKPISIYSGTTLFGHAKFFAANAGSVSVNGLIQANAQTGVKIQGIEIDGNGNNNGTYYGILLYGGSGNEVVGTYIHDTTAAGISIQNESDTVVASRNRVINCGRAAASTDAHGIMVITTGSTVYSGVRVHGNIVSGAYRKGVAVEAQGTVGSDSYEISDNVITGCGIATSVGGLYVSGTSQHTGMTITGNTCNENYLDIQIANVDYSTITGNTSYKPTGSYGIYIADSNYNTITGNNASFAPLQGLLVTTNTGTAQGNTIVGNNATNSSQAGVGLYAGIELLNAGYNTVGLNTSIGESVSPKQAYGIFEAGTSDNNSFFGNTVLNTSTGTTILLSGANSVSISPLGANLDIQGSLALRDANLSTTGGDITVGPQIATAVLVGPVAPFSITGVTAGIRGREITLINGTATTMTIVHNNSSTPVGVRIYTPGGTNISLSQYGSVNLIWSLALGEWIAR